MSLGDYIIIERQTGQYTYEGCCVSTNTMFDAIVDPDKYSLFDDRSFNDSHPSACPFLRPRGLGYICSIHVTSPFQCKFYRCKVFLISNKDGQQIGYITGTMALISEDKILRNDFEKAMIDFSYDEEKLKALLEMRGYMVSYGP